MYNALRYPEGVPNPFVPMVETYPNYVHGPDYTRAEFGAQYVVNPFAVNLYAPYKGDIRGLGAVSDAQLADMHGLFLGTLAGGATLASLAFFASMSAKNMSTKQMLGATAVAGLIGAVASLIGIEVYKQRVSVELSTPA